MKPTPEIIAGKPTVDAARPAIEAAKTSGCVMVRGSGLRISGVGSRLLPLQSIRGQLVMKQLIQDHRSIRLALLSSLAANGAAASLNAGVALQWSSAVGGNDHWYMCYRFAEVTDWTVAHSLAQSWGGYLATITSAQENQFVFDVSLAQGGWDPSHPSGPYLGARKNASNQFEWVTGEAFTYTNWLPGEPSSGLWEPYLNFLGGGPGTTTPHPYWNDINGSQFTAMFEFNTAPVPSPGAIALGSLVRLVSLGRRRK